MNKFLTTILAILGGIEVVFSLAVPIIIAIFWINIIGLVEWTSYLFIIVCFIATMVRAIKIGWMKK